MSVVVETVYLLDDLSGRVRECAVAIGLEETRVAELLALIRRTTLEAANAFPLGEVSVELLSWEHVTESLRVRLAGESLLADSTLILGDGGARLVRTLEDWGITIRGRLEIPVAKMLDDPTNAFFSPHWIGQRDRQPLRATTNVAGDVLVVDDCVQTGMTFDAVIEANGAGAGTVVTGICNEATLARLQATGWVVHYGVLLPGPTYPESYSADLFCVRDFVVTDAVRFADGTSTSYSSGGDWLQVLYGNAATSESVRKAWAKLVDALERAGVEA